MTPSASLRTLSIALKKRGEELPALHNLHRSLQQGLPLLLDNSQQFVYLLVGIGITMDIYSHVMPNMQRDAIANFNIVLDPVK